MPVNFRSELFSLCKTIQNQECSKQIRDIIIKMSSVKNPIDGNEEPLHGDFAQVANHSNNQFHGYLYLDDNIDTISLPKIFKVEHLSKDERYLIERGHRTLLRFVELCLSDIKMKSNSVAESMHPYFLYKEVRLSPESTAFVSDEVLQPAVTAFKQGSVYKAIMEADLTAFFSRVSINEMRMLVGTIEKEINESLGKNVTKDLKEFSLKLDSQFNNITDVLFAFSILLLAIKNSLALACRLLYKAICGGDLFVLNNDNIISIEKNISSVLFHYYKVFSQDIYFDRSGSGMGNILLMDCDLNHEQHLHEFGMLISETINIAGEFGQSAKYSFVTVNEEMIYLHFLIDKILEIGLPPVK